MGTEVVVAIVSAVIAGIFQLIGKRMEFAHSGGATSPAALFSGQPSGAITPDGRVNFGLALRQIGILQLALNLVGFVVGMAMGSVGANMDEAIVAILFIGTLLLIAGFVWVALSGGGAVNWRHMITVALGVAVITVVINAIILELPLTMLALVIALIQTFISMGIGGAIATKIRS